MNRYIRQTTLSEVGEQGQQKLLNAKVLVIGCGGLGSEVTVHLAASGVGFIHLIDFDQIDLSNIHRQVFYKETDVSKYKAEVLAEYVSKINSNISVSFDTTKIEKSNIRILVSKYDYVLDCTDDLLTKYLINDACVLESKILIYGSLHKFEGHVAVFNSKDLLGNRTTNLRDVYPEIPTESIPSCSEVGTLNSIVSIIANMQVNEVLKLILGIGEVLINKMLIYNSLDNSQLRLNLKVNDEMKLSTIWKTEFYDNINTAFCSDTEISQKDFNNLVLNNEVKVISVLDEIIKLDCNINLHLPFSSFDLDKISLRKNDYVVVCKKGIISLKAAKLLKEKYPNYSIRSLIGGINSFI